MFVVIFGAVFWVYRSVINQLGDDPLTVIELVTRAEHEGFHSTTDESYSKTSLLYLMSNFYQHIHSVLDSLRHQNQSISKNSVELVSSAKRFEGLIDAASLEGKRVGDNLTENKKQIQQTHSSLASSGQYLEVVASRVTDSIIINTNNEKEIQKIEASIASDANELVKLSQNLRRFDTLIEAFNDFYDQYQSSDNGAVETSLDISIENTPPAFFVKHTEAVAQAKAVLSELDAGVEALKGSIKQSERGLAQYLNSFGEQRLSLVSLGENLASVQLHIEQVVQAQTCLLDEMPNGLDQHFDVILSSLVIITESIDEYKTTSDKMSHDLDSIYF
jgi:chromosome segregation ATPase